MGRVTKRQGQRRGGLWDAATRRGPLQVLSWGLVVQIVRSRKSSWARCAPLGTGRRPPRRLLALTERAGAQLRAGFGETLGAHGSRRTGKAHAPRAPAPRMASLLSGGNVSAACRPLRGCTVTHLLSSQFRRRTRGSGWPHRWWRERDQDLSLRCQHTVLAPAATRKGPDTLIHVYKDM